MKARGMGEKMGKEPSDRTRCPSQSQGAEKEHRGGEKVQRTGDGCRAASRLTAVLWDTGWATAAEEAQI